MSIVVVPKFNFTQFLQSIVKYRITSLKYSHIHFSRNMTGSPWLKSGPLTDPSPL